MAAPFCQDVAAKADTNLLYLTKDHSFGKGCRLSDGMLIRQTLRSGDRREGEHIGMHRFPTPGVSSRWCFRVPKRLGNAPTRNRVRRLMREYVRTHKELWPIDSAIVLSAKQTAVNLGFSQVSAQLEQLLDNE